MQSLDNDDLEAAKEFCYLGNAFNASVGLKWKQWWKQESDRWECRKFLYKKRFC